MPTRQPSRFSRMIADIAGWFGRSRRYAARSGTAEIGAALVLAHTGIPPQPASGATGSPSSGMLDLIPLPYASIEPLLADVAAAADATGSPPAITELLAADLGMALAEADGTLADADVSDSSAPALAPVPRSSVPKLLLARQLRGVARLNTPCARRRLGALRAEQTADRRRAPRAEPWILSRSGAGSRRRATSSRAAAATPRPGVRKTLAR